MSKDNPRTARECDRLAERNGFECIRQNGSHAIYRHEDGRQVVIPQHNGDIPRGTLRAILAVIAGALIVGTALVAPIGLALLAYVATAP